MDDLKNGLLKYYALESVPSEEYDNVKGGLWVSLSVEWRKAQNFKTLRCQMPEVLYNYITSTGCVIEWQSTTDLLIYPSSDFYERTRIIKNHQLRKML